MLSDSMDHKLHYFTYGMNLDISLSQINFLSLCKQNLEDILLNLYLFQVLMSVSALKIHALISAIVFLSLQQWSSNTPE